MFPLLLKGDLFPSYCTFHLFPFISSLQILYICKYIYFFEWEYVCGPSFVLIMVFFCYCFFRLSCFFGNGIFLFLLSVMFYFSILRIEFFFQRRRKKYMFSLPFVNKKALVFTPPVHPQLILRHPFPLSNTLRNSHCTK